MTIKRQILRHAKEADKCVLLWLLKRYKLSSFKYGLAARYKRVRYWKRLPFTFKAWEPTAKGKLLYWVHVKGATEKEAAKGDSQR